MKARTVVLALGGVLALAMPVSARLWKPTPAQLAADYTTISHNKGGTGGRITIQWIAPPVITAGNLAQVLDKLVVISVTHTVVAPGGLPEWEDIEGVEVTDAAGQALKQVPDDAIPPTLVSLIAAADATLRQSTQGKGKSKMMVFEAGAVHACTKGGLVVAFEGERYTFDTPIPGCAPTP